MKKLLLAFLLLIAPNLYAQTIGASVGITTTAFNAVDLTTPAGDSPGFSLAIGTNGASVLTWQTIYSAAPSTVTVLLLGSTDCVTYDLLGTSTDTSGEIRNIFGSMRCIKFSNTVATGGAGKTLSVKFVYSTGRAVGQGGAPVYAGGDFTGAIFLPDGADVAPSLSFSSARQTGFYYSGTDVRFVSNTNGIFHITDTTFHLETGVPLAWGGDTWLFRGTGGGRLQLRNGGTAGAPVPQTYEVYGFCDGNGCATGDTRLVMAGSSTGFNLTTQATGTGTTAGSRGFVSTQGSKTNTLTEASATAFVNIAIPDGGHVGGEVIYDIYCADGTPNYVARSCTANFVCINKADTENCNVQTPACSGDANSSGGSFSANTLDYVAGTNSINLRETATCSLGQTVLEIHYRLNLTDTQTITPQ